MDSLGPWHVVWLLCGIFSIRCVLCGIVFMVCLRNKAQTGSSHVGRRKYRGYAGYIGHGTDISVCSVNKHEPADQNNKDTYQMFSRKTTGTETMESSTNFSYSLPMVSLDYGDDDW